MSRSSALSSLYRYYSLPSSLSNLCPSPLSKSPLSPPTALMEEDQNANHQSSPPPPPPPPPSPPRPPVAADDIADDLQSMSFNSTATDAVPPSTSSSSETTTTTTTWTTGGSSFSKPNLPPSSGDPRWSAVGRSGPAGISISDIRFISRLGSGDIGSVYLAELKWAGGVHFAAKVMDTRELAARNKQGRARAEREILQTLDHPFLPTLYASVESTKWSCLLTEFCNGGDLHVLRQRQPFKRFEESAVRFYASEVVVALEYIHMMGVVYRDLKPENVLVRSDGHIMLTDFDLSLRCDDHSTPTPQIITSSNQSFLNSNQNPSLLGSRHDPSAANSSCIIPNCIVPTMSCFNPSQKNKWSKSKKKKKPNKHFELEFVAEPIDVRSMSFVGTHEYLAPEIVSGEGHGSAVDWWTLGVFIFELFYGITPFKGVDNEMTLANIVARALEFPKEPSVPASAKDLMAQLLVKDPIRRLGSVMGATPIKQHPFFNSVNWALLRCMKPPFVPPPFTCSNNRSREVASDDSCPDTPIEYY